MPDYDFITTYTGVHFFPTRPDPDGVRIVDVAHALSCLPGRAGHVRTFFSGPALSPCAREALALKPSRQVVFLACLLHDASKPTSPMSPGPSGSISPSTGRWKTVCWPPSTKNT